MKAITKILVIVVLGVATSTLLYSMVISSLLSEVDFINVDVRAKKAELDVLQKQITAFKTAQSDLAQATRKDELLEVIPDKENLVVTVLDLEAAATITQTVHELKIVEPDSKDKKPVVAVVSKKVGIDEVVYNLSTTSDFMAMVNFLNYLEHLPHFTEISKINLVSEQTKDSSEIVNRTGMVGGEFSGVFFIRQKK